MSGKTKSMRLLPLLIYSIIFLAIFSGSAWAKACDQDNHCPAPQECCVSTGQCVNPDHVCVTNCGEYIGGSGFCNPQAGLSSISDDCAQIDYQVCCEKADGCKWLFNSCRLDPGPPAHINAFIQCSIFNDNPDGCQIFGDPLVSDCTWVNKPPDPPPVTCGSVTAGSGYCAMAPGAVAGYCGGITNSACCNQISGCTWNIDECTPTGSIYLPTVCANYNDNKDGCLMVGNSGATCVWTTSGCAQLGQSCLTQSCCAGLSCNTTSLLGTICCLPDASPTSCYAGSQCCSGICKNHKCEAAQCAVVPTIPSYLDVTLDPAAHQINALLYNLTEATYNKTALPNALIFMVNLSDKANINMCYDSTDADGWLNFPYSPDAPGCTDYWFIFCPFSAAAQSDDAGRNARELCLNSTKLNYDTIIYPAPTVCLNKPAPTLANYPTHILSHNVLYFCNTVPKDYAPLCWPLMLILGLLLGASFAVGKNPLAAFDLSSPRMQRGRQYTPRVQNKSFDLLGYLMAAAGGVSSVKGAAKGKGKEKEGAGAEDKVKPAKEHKTNMGKALHAIGQAFKGSKSKDEDSKARASGEGGPHWNKSGKDTTHKTWAGRAIHNTGRYLRNDFNQTFGLGKAGATATQEKGSNPNAPTTGTGSNTTLAIIGGSQNTTASIIGVFGAFKALRRGKEDRKTLKADIKANASAKNSKYFTDMAASAKKSGDAQGYIGASITSIFTGGLKGKNFGQALLEILKLLANVVLIKYGLGTDDIKDIFKKGSWKGGVKPVVNKLIDIIKLITALYSIVCEISAYSKIYKNMGGNSQAKGFMDNFNDTSMFKIGNYNVNVNAVASYLDPRMQAAGTGAGIYIPYPLTYIVNPVMDGLKLGLGGIAQAIDDAVEKKKSAPDGGAPKAMATSTPTEEGMVGVLPDGKGNNQYYKLVPEGAENQKGAYNHSTGTFTITTSIGEENTKIRESGFPIKESPLPSVAGPELLVKKAIWVPIPGKELTDAAKGELDKLIKTGGVVLVKSSQDGKVTELSSKQRNEFLQRQMARNTTRMEVQEYLVKSFGDFMGERRLSKKASSIRALELQNECLEAQAEGKGISETGVAINYGNMKLVQDYVNKTTHLVNELNSQDIAERAVDLINNAPEQEKLSREIENLKVQIAGMQPGTREYKVAESRLMELEAISLMTVMLENTEVNNKGVDKMSVRQANKLVQRELALELDLANAMMPAYIRANSPEAREKINDVFAMMHSNLKACMEDKNDKMAGDLADQGKLDKSIKEITLRLDAMEVQVDTFKKNIQYMQLADQKAMQGLLDKVGAKERAKTISQEAETAAWKGRKDENSAALQEEAKTAKENLDKETLNVATAMATLFASTMNQIDAKPSFTIEELMGAGVLTKKQANKIGDKEYYTADELKNMIFRVSYAKDKENKPFLSDKQLENLEKLENSAPTPQDEWAKLSSRPQYTSKIVQDEQMAELAKMSSWPEKVQTNKRVDSLDMSLLPALNAFSAKMEVQAYDFLKNPPNKASTEQLKQEQIASRSNDEEEQKKNQKGTVSKKYEQTKQNIEKHDARMAAKQGYIPSMLDKESPLPSAQIKEPEPSVPSRSDEILGNLGKSLGAGPAKAKPKNYDVAQGQVEKRPERTEAPPQEEPSDVMRKRAPAKSKKPRSRPPRGADEETEA